jgi:hypothetical protein
MKTGNCGAFSPRPSIAVESADGCAQANALVASANNVRSLSRFVAAAENTPGPNARRISFLTSEHHERARCLIGVEKSATGKISRRQSQNAVFPVAIPPVIPIAGTSKLKRSIEGGVSGKFHKQKLRLPSGWSRQSERYRLENVLIVCPVVNLVSSDL